MGFNQIPCAKLPEFVHPFIGVQATANDMMLHGIMLNGVHTSLARVTTTQAREIMRQICDERDSMNAELDKHFDKHHRPAPSRCRCRVCGEEVDDKLENMRDHLEGHSNHACNFSAAEIKNQFVGL